MRIGELAEKAGVPATAIRFYEQIGVVARPSRAGNGYRDYSEAALDDLRFVRAGQAAGLSLRDLAEIVAVRNGGAPADPEARTLIERCLHDTDRRLRDLERVRGDLTGLLRDART